jgi:uncharacterized membrane protein
MLSRLPGVTRLEDRTEPLPAREPFARAAGRRSELAYQSDLLKSGWSPPARFGVGLIGVAALASARRLPAEWRNVARIFGIASLVRAITNRYVTELVGSIANPTMTLERTLHLDAAVDDVYDFLRDFRNYARFMSFVGSVEINETGGIRWTLSGPGSLRLSWDATVQALIPNQLIAWKSSSGSPIHSAGAIRLEPGSAGGTEVFVELSYAPPAGAIGFALASAIGFDPKARIDEDLEVLKLLIEGELRPGAPLRHRASP